VPDAEVRGPAPAVARVGQASGDLAAAGRIGELRLTGDDALTSLEVVASL
jgi:hypothetical protein